MEGSCCFCGWREIPPARQSWLESRLAEEVAGLVEKGITRFLSGAAPGFETLAARTVIRVRERAPGVRLVLVLPCLDLTWGWSPEEAEAYREVSAGADLRVLLAQRYSPGCIRRQGRYLVDHSGVCLCWFPPGGRGGYGWHSVIYARERGVPVWELGAERVWDNSRQNLRPQKSRPAGP